MSGGADSVYLLDISRKECRRLVVGHYNHGARGKASERDERFVERLCEDWMLQVIVGKSRSNDRASRVAGRREGQGSRFEEKAREARYAFLRDLRERHGAQKILVAHTADDQVETVLMRVLEGAGISGLKGIPRRGADGVERPLLDTWREDILRSLRRRKIPYRTDKSNLDTRFERNWIRHVLIPLLEKRYGKTVKRRIFVLGERFREIDDFLETTVRRWVKRNVKAVPGAVPAFRVPRAAYAKLPSVVRKKTLQVLCFEGMKVAPNERLLQAMDTIIVSGKPSARLSVGRGVLLSCRYGDAVLRAARDAGVPENGGAAVGALVVRALRGKTTPARLRSLAAGERKAVVDADAVSGPLRVRAVRAGDCIRPFGAAAPKKVKEIMIDRKVPRDERWGRPVVCDANGEIVWIPGIVRSAAAPVTRETRRTIVLELRKVSTT